jgi:chromosome segregation ATPase
VEARAPEGQKLDALLQEMQRLNTELTTAQAQAKRADDALKVTETTRAQLVQAETSLAQKVAELTGAQSRIEDLQHNVSRLEQTRQELAQRLSASESTVRETREALVAAETAKSAAAQQAVSLSAQVQRATSETDGTPQGIGDLSSRVALIPGLESRLMTATQERDQLQKDVEKLKEEYAIARTWRGCERRAHASTHQFRD